VKGPIITHFFFLVVLTSILACTKTPVDPSRGESTAQESSIIQGTELEHLTWLEAEKVLTEEAVVVIPLGARRKVW
jgi:hypothetical protein